MVQELMWVCAIAPGEFRKTAVQLCLAENKLHAKSRLCTTMDENKEQMR